MCLDKNRKGRPGFEPDVVTELKRVVPWWIAPLVLPTKFRPTIHNCILLLRIMYYQSLDIGNLRTQSTVMIIHFQITVQGRMHKQLLCYIIITSLQAVLHLCLQKNSRVSKNLIHNQQTVILYLCVSFIIVKNSISTNYHYVWQWYRR